MIITKSAIFVKSIGIQLINTIIHQSYSKKTPKELMRHMLLFCYSLRTVWKLRGENFVFYSQFTGISVNIHFKGGGAGGFWSEGQLVKMEVLCLWPALPYLSICNTQEAWIWRFFNFLFPIFKLLSRSKPSYLLPWYQIFYDLLALTPKFEVFYEIINQLPISLLKTLICLPGIAFFWDKHLLAIVNHKSCYCTADR